MDENLERQYVVSKLRADFPVLTDLWAERSAAFRTLADGACDIAYAGDAREKLDIFHCGVPQAPLLIYLHGGYWQRGDKSVYSFIARPFVEKGVDVAVVGYPLCPQVSLSSLVDSVRRALVFLYRNALTLGISPGRFNICGNSAGGHLVAMMCATRWPGMAAGLPPDLVRFAAPVSGLYRLEPLRHTSLNEAVGMDDGEARANSPVLMPDASAAPIMIAVGGAETRVFFEQRDALSAAWRSESRAPEHYVEPRADHFDIIERIGDADSGIFREIFSRLR